MAVATTAAAAAAASAVRRQILSRFPGSFSFCFAYGSGVKQQLGYVDPNNATTTAAAAAAAAVAGTAAAAEDGQQRSTAAVAAAAVAQASTKKAGMIDLILCVDDAQSFHRQNVSANPGDYSALARLLGSDAVCQLQESAVLGARVYCNTLIPLGDGSGQSIKYGVVSTADMVDDLLHWRHLYVAGRLHKPVDVLHDEGDGAVLRAALRRNLESAVRVALLRLPERFGYYELFYAIANLSYAGDFRMLFGEHPNKVQNIVRPQLVEFRRLYAGVLERLERADVLQRIDDVADDGGANAALERVRIVQKSCAATRLEHLRALPAQLRDELGADGHSDEALERLVHERPEQIAERLERGTERIVWTSSVGQSLKNIPTAGVAKSLQYSWQKVLKTFRM